MNTKDTPPANPETRGRRWFASAAAAGGLSLLAAGAHAQSGWGAGWGRHGGMDPEALARRMDYRIGYLVKEIGGSTEQKDKLLAIAQATLKDLKPLREQHMAARQKGLELLSAASIDANALEQLRVSQMQAADATSQRVVKALVEAAEVLSPAQRAQLAQRMKQRMARRHRGMAG